MSVSKPLGVETETMLCTASVTLLATGLQRTAKCSDPRKVPPFTRSNPTWLSPSSLECKLISATSGQFIADSLPTATSTAMLWKKFT